jgi:hypothetical protein
MKHVAVEATKKAHVYERELSGQLSKDLMIERGIAYDDKEAKNVELYQRHGKYATAMIRLIPESCDALKRDQPEFSNEEIKARIAKEFSEELKYSVKGSPEELIQPCWPDWIK